MVPWYFILIVALEVTTCCTVESKKGLILSGWKRTRGSCSRGAGVVFTVHCNLAKRSVFEPAIQMVGFRKFVTGGSMVIITHPKHCGTFKTQNKKPFVIYVLCKKINAGILFRKFKITFGSYTDTNFALSSFTVKPNTHPRIFVRKVILHCSTMYN